MNQASKEGGYQFGPACVSDFFCDSVDEFHFIVGYCCVKSKSVHGFSLYFVMSAGHGTWATGHLQDRKVCACLDVFLTRFLSRLFSVLFSLTFLICLIQINYKNKQQGIFHHAAGVLL